MNFVSVAYLIFLAISCLLYYIMPKAARPIWMLACSYIFYTYSAGNAQYVWILIAASVLVYACALIIDSLPSRGTAVRKIVLGIGIVVSLLPLLYYKYADFALRTFADITGGRFTALNLVAPLGISYFIFMGIGYMIDVYRGKIEAERNPLYVALFLSFFPCIVAGPIERATNMFKQYKADIAFDYNKFTGGAFRVMWGMAKMLVLSLGLSSIISAVYGHMASYNGPILLLASLLFSYQLYIDFSALSDIAIGTGAMFGFDIMENFARPLASPSISDLWRRWHISLSSWFRDYIYFPLGGSRKGKIRAHVNQMIVMAVSGLWHGASFGYLIWGLLNGVYLCVGKETAKIREKAERYNPLYKLSFTRTFFKACVTYLLFTSAIVFFCAEINAGGVTDALYLYGHLFTGWNTLFTPAFGNTLVAIGFDDVTKWTIILGILLVEGFEYTHEPVNKLIRRMPIFLRWPLYITLFLAIAYLGNFGTSNFIYAQY